MTHGRTDAQFLDMVAPFLGWYYIALAVMNGVAALYLWRTNRGKTLFSLPFGERGLPVTTALIWLLVSFVFVLMAAVAGNASGAESLSMPESWREAINRSTGPVIYSVGTVVLLAILFIFRRFFVNPTVAWTIWNLMLLFLGLSMT